MSTPVVRAEGFSMTEWSARGLSLAGGMVARADDASAIAYNAAGITQLPGTQLMGGITVISPYGSIENNLAGGGTHTTHVKPAVWTPFHGYITHQLNDNVWLGFGVFSRFGLGNSYSGTWAGRYNVYDVGLQTFSAVPTIAYKINDMFSVSLGVELMYLSLYEGVKVPDVDMATRKLRDNDMQLNGSSLGVGLHAGVHARFNDQWSAGLTYKSQVTQQVHGDAKFDYQGKSPIAKMNMKDSDINGTLQLPDSVSFAVAYKPIDRLSFEVGTVWTRWSTYNALNIYFDDPSGYRSINNKEWRDGWNVNASVEYKALDWLTLRAGYWYESPVVNSSYSDYMLPTNGRDVVTMGAGFNWDNWTLDVAYAHIWIHALSYNDSTSTGVHVAKATTGGKTKNTEADMFTVSLGYTF
ncbi:MAG: outer membrane protein transport protein [Desulfovibrionaceae bacterium]